MIERKIIANVEVAAAEAAVEVQPGNWITAKLLMLYYRLWYLMPKLVAV